MNQHNNVLEDSELITNSEGSWGSLLFLAKQPHQEDCFNINTFILRLRVSYWSLNSISRSFEYHISRYDNTIENLGDSCDSL